MSARHGLTSAILALAVGILGLGCLVVPAGVAAADEDPHARHREMMQRKKDMAAQSVTVKLPEGTLVNQAGESVDVAADMVGDAIVVVDFIYTTCTTVCPVLSAIMLQVQAAVGDRLGDDVRLVSISVDPLRDTPERLSSYAKKLHAGNGWQWLTGDKLVVDEVLRAFGAFTPNFEDHPAMVLVGDGSTGQWARFVGFPGANHIIAKIDEFTTARSAQSAVKE